MIYLDNNATTAVDPEVSDAVFSSLRRDLGNPSSAHLPGRNVKATIDQSRQVISEMLGCAAEEIYFTSGGTESNNLALIGTALAHGKGHIIISAIEHPSVMNTCGHLESLGFGLTLAPVDGSCVVDPAGVKNAIRKDTVLISVMHSNNETGAIQPVDEIGRIAREHGVTFHTDAAQSVGKTDFSVTPVIDMATVVSHKFYGPKGIGALYIKNGARIKPVLYGAGHERGMRPGTENVPGIAGLAKACEIAMRDMKMRISHTAHLSALLSGLLRDAMPDITLNAENAPRLPNTLNIRVPDIAAYKLVEILKDQVAFSAGSACHAGSCSPSGVLKRMGLSDADAVSSIRLSVGKDNTEEEMKNAAELIACAVKALRNI
ncbi:MAG: cysteine desulfurase [Nitrospirae bacterium]|nr:cysteine desulfurase [Nitrospirota bacterium]